MNNKMKTIVTLLLCHVISSMAHNVKEDGMFLCKKLDSEFSMVIESPKTKPKPSNTNKSNQKAKPGPRGPPGQRGKPGEINEKLLEQKIEEKLKKLEERVSFLEKVNKVEVRKDEGAPTLKEPCHIFYRSRCFKFVKKDKGTLDAHEAKSSCEKLKGELANIYDKAHFEQIEIYLREMMSDEDKMIYFIVGMTYNIRGEAVVLRHGKKAPFVVWYSDRFPVLNRKSTQIQIQVNKDETNESGMYNTSPLTKAKSALCEIPERFI